MVSHYRNYSGQGRRKKVCLFITFKEFIMASGKKTMFLARPNVSANSFASQTPLTASIEPVVLFSILDHALRRNVNQKRVIGTMLGVRSDDGTEIEIRNCFAVPHNESSEQVFP
jgi:translation initiation factor 3 subunit F